MPNDLSKIWGLLSTVLAKREKSIRPDIRNLLYNTDIRSRNTADIKDY